MLRSVARYSSWALPRAAGGSRNSFLSAPLLEDQFSFLGHPGSRVLSSEAIVRRIPPNLKFDPRSSFAAKSVVHKDIDVDVDEHDNMSEGDDLDDDGLYLPDGELVYAVPLPERLHVQIHTLFAPEHSSQVGTIWLNDAVFGRDPIRVDLLKRSVDYYRAKARGRRKAKTKTISEVSGSGRKIRNQKGTGMARAGHSRPPHFRGGAKAHGPKNVTDYGNTKLNKKVRKLALVHALSQKLLEGNLIILNSLKELPSHKTKELTRFLEPWDIGGKDGATALILDAYISEEEGQPQSYKGVPMNLWVASSNIYRIKVGNHLAACVYDILKHEKLVLTLAALEKLEDRLREV
jgi:large subunit ribosomal protein L4